MEIIEQFRAAAERGNHIPGVAYRAKARDWVALLKSGDSSCWLVNQNGCYALHEQAPQQPVTFTLEAAEEDWRQLFEAVPKPGWQTLNGMIMSGRLTLHGDSLTFHQYLMALELMFGKLPSEIPPEVPARAPAIEPVTGRYLNLVHEGREHRIYFEEAGEGPPLLCLHTAGADGRQYRGVLNDAEVTSRHRVIVFDLPRHGKSSFAPGAGGDAYLLTTDAYVRLVLAVADALGLDKPVVMGCSIGGRAVLHLALRHGDRFRAAIGLQSALFADPGGEDFSGASAASIFRPDANGAEIGAAMVAGITAPDSPAADRWETLWYYMQGAPGVFLGDLYYYFVDGDLRNQLTGRPDELGCPLYLLTGEYDLSATPEMTAEVAELTGAEHFEVMRGLGHFPMSENYAVFRNYLHRVLKLIQKQT